MFLISVPIVSALIGWATNRVAIQMLFRPRRPVRLMGATWQGLIPRRQVDIAEKAADIVKDELLTEHVLQQEVRKMKPDPYVDQYALHLVWDRLGPKLRGIPILGRAITDRVLVQINVMVAEELRREAREFLERVAVDAEQHIDVRRLVEDRIKAFPVEELERLVYRLAGREFRQIELMGGVLGFVIGLFQVLLFILTGM